MYLTATKVAFKNKVFF